MAATHHDMVRQGIPPQALGYKGDGRHVAQGGGRRQSGPAQQMPANKK